MMAIVHKSLISILQQPYRLGVIRCLRFLISWRGIRSSDQPRDLSVVNVTSSENRTESFPSFTTNPDASKGKSSSLYFHCYNLVNDYNHSQKLLTRIVIFRKFETRV